MKIDRRVTNGLAWAGVLLVVGIPTADLLSAQFMGDPARASAQPPVQVAAVVERIAPIPAPLSQRPSAPVAKPEAQVANVTPAAPVASAVPAKPVAQVAVATPTKSAVPTTVPPAAETAGVVAAWLNSGKPLPSYITDEAAAPTQVAATPPVRTPIVTAPATTPPLAPAAVDPVQVASIPQPKVAPVPMPLSMRPHPVATTPVAVVRPSTDLIVAPSANGPRPPANIDADDLADWESGPLSEFLAQRQAQAGQVQSAPQYDEDGFFLDEGPNTPRRQRDRLIGPADDFFFPFVN